MKERMIDIATPDGKMETFVTHLENGGPFAAVVVYMDVWGVREELFEIARRIATVGYCGVVPDLYYRQGKVGHLYRDGDNRMISFHNLDEARRDEVTAPMLGLSNAMVMSDTGAVIEFLRGEQRVPDGRMGCTEY